MHQNGKLNGSTVMISFTRDPKAALFEPLCSGICMCDLQIINGFNRPIACAISLLKLLGNATRPSAELLIERCFYLEQWNDRPAHVVRDSNRKRKQQNDTKRREASTAADRATLDRCVGRAAHTHSNISNKTKLSYHDSFTFYSLYCVFALDSFGSGICMDEVCFEHFWTADLLR